MKVSFGLYDGDKNLTQDHIGSPLVRVSIKIGDISVINNGLALIDTGANQSIIKAALVQWCSASGWTTTQHAGGAGNVPTYLAEVSLPDVQYTDVIPIGAHQLNTHDFIIGRDILKGLRLIYDPVTPEFTLENPNV